MQPFLRKGLYVHLLLPLPFFSWQSVSAFAVTLFLTERPVSAGLAPVERDVVHSSERRTKHELRGLEERPTALTNSSQPAEE
jgi:hypothetical protein